MVEHQHYFDRELSWLSFNYRVLKEAEDESLPLYERIKFLAIYSSNLDEFYRVRVASYRSVSVTMQKNNSQKFGELESLLSLITQEVELQQEKLNSLFHDKIIPILLRNNIVLYQNTNIETKHLEFISQYFSCEVLPNVQPVLIEKGKIFSFLQDNVIYLAVKLFRKSKKYESGELPRKKLTRFAIIKLPTTHLPRFVLLPKIVEKYYIMFLEDVIRLNLNVLFPGYLVDSSYTIKVSRDADLQIEDEFSGNLVEKIKASLSRRKIGVPACFLYDHTIPKDFLKFLRQAFNLSKYDLVAGGRYLSLSDFLKFPTPITRLGLKYPPSLNHKELDKDPTFFNSLKEKDFMLHFPYQSYDYVLKFLHQAAVDPKVEEIKCTQYRVASNSAVVNALLSAARNGKKVTVFIEVKARFDEENNLQIAEQMKEAGVNVIASIPGMKVHAKVVLILRKSSSSPDKLRGYAFISTGNFNEKTAKIYADHGFFTAHEGIIEDLKSLFNYIENRSTKSKFKHLLVSPFNLQKELIKKMDREILNAKEKKPSGMILKMNSLEDEKMIDKLYEASLAGVKIELIVRGICRLIPSRDFSENITVTRIVDQYLEHARVFAFENCGKNEVYIASADWMKRNLYRRLEIAVPIYDAEIRKELIDILQIQLRDNTKACWIDWELRNVPKPSTKEKNRAQIDTYRFLKRKSL